MRVPGVVVQQTWVVSFSCYFYPVRKLHTSSSSLVQYPILMAGGKHHRVHWIFHWGVVNFLQYLMLGFMQAFRGAVWFEGRFGSLEGLGFRIKGFRALEMFWLRAFQVCVFQSCSIQAWGSGLRSQVFGVRDFRGFRK